MVAVASRSMRRSRWVLRAFMAQHKIKNSELAKAMGKNAVSIARLKAADTIPGIGGAAIDEMCDALTRVLRDKGVDLVVDPRHLIEIYDD